MSASKIQKAAQKAFPGCSVEYGYNQRDGEMVRGYWMNQHTGYQRDSAIWMGSNVATAMDFLDNEEVRQQAYSC